MDEIYAGACYEITLLPDETLEAVKNMVAIKGPLTTPVGESVIMLLRQLLDLYVCQRPIRWFEGVPIKKCLTIWLFFREFRRYLCCSWYESGTNEVKELIDFHKIK